MSLVSLRTLCQSIWHIQEQEERTSCKWICRSPKSKTGQRSKNMDDESYILHAAICENDVFIQDTLSDYVATLSRKLGFLIKIHQYTRMTLNPQTLIKMCNCMNLVIINAEFDEKGTSFCKELLVSAENVEVDSFLSLVGAIQIPVNFETFRILFHRAIGQLLCQRQIQSRNLNIMIGRTKVSLEYESIISLQKMGEKVEIKGEQGIYFAAYSLKSLKEKLPAYFIQINQKTIINTKEILFFDETDRKLAMKNKEEHVVTQVHLAYLEQFLRSRR